MNERTRCTNCDPESLGQTYRPEWRECPRCHRPGFRDEYLSGFYDPRTDTTFCLHCMKCRRCRTTGAEMEPFAQERVFTGAYVFTSPVIMDRKLGAPLIDSIASAVSGLAKAFADDPIKPPTRKEMDEWKLRKQLLAKARPHELDRATLTHERAPHRCTCDPPWDAMPPRYERCPGCDGAGTASTTMVIGGVSDEPGITVEIDDEVVEIVSSQELRTMAADPPPKVEPPCSHRYTSATLDGDEHHVCRNCGECRDCDERVDPSLFDRGQADSIEAGFVPIDPIATVTMSGHTRWSSEHSDPAGDIKDAVEVLRAHGVEGFIDAALPFDLFDALATRLTLDDLPADTVLSQRPLGGGGRTTATISSMADPNIRVELRGLV